MQNLKLAIHCYQTQYQIATIDYLDQFRDTAVYLNRKRFELSTNKTMDSGDSDLFLLVSGEQVHGCFFLSKGGIFHFHSDAKLLNAEVCEEVFDIVAAQTNPIKALFGPWDACDILHRQMIYNGIWQKFSYKSREVCFLLQTLPSFPESTRSDSIKILRPEDLDSFMRLRGKYFDELGMVPWQSDFEIQHDYLQRSRQSGVWGFFKDQDLVACNFLRPCGDSQFLIEGLFVDSEFRNQGIAKSLLMKQISWLKENDVDSVSLYTGSENHAAQNLFVDLGFVATREFAVIIS
ncbi:MAG: GNAT family N-acetyltransferase [Pseudobacteriovorax sp.]|nr:GNAT family N-acetyltransferase [Pseudobacteriovorax sp.]